MYNPSWVLFIIIVEVAYSYIGVRVGGFKGPFFVTDIYQTNRLSGTHWQYVHSGG